MNNYFRIDYVTKDMPIDIKKSVIYQLKDFPSIFREVIDVFNDNIDGKGYERLSIYPMYNTQTLVDNFMNIRREELVNINEMMIEGGRAPLFPHPEKIKESWNIRDHLMEYLPEEVLNKEFGCESYKKYTPTNIFVKPTKDDSTHTPR